MSDLLNKFATQVKEVIPKEAPKEDDDEAETEPIEDGRLGEASANRPSRQDVPKPKPEQTLTRLERRRIAERHRREQRKEEVERLRRSQIKGCEVILFNINGKISRRELANEKDYLDLIEDMLGTLKDNELLHDFDMAPLRHHKPLDS